MGMYNEVYLECPKCKAKGKHSLAEACISQVTPAYGGHVLDDLKGMHSKLDAGELTSEQVKLLAECSADTWFKCDNDEDHAFKADPAVLLALSLLADRFKSASTNDTLTRAEAMLREIYPD